MTTVWLRTLNSGICPIVAFLLVVMTPVGTGQSGHSDQLLDPLFPHLHFLGGVVTRPSVVRLVALGALDSRPRGPALGAAAGAVEAGLSAGLTPVVPGRLEVTLVDGLIWRIGPPDLTPSGATADPPPDPPPTSG